MLRLPESLAFLSFCLLVQFVRKFRLCLRAHLIHFRNIDFRFINQIFDTVDSRLGQSLTDIKNVTRGEDAVVRFQDVPRRRRKADARKPLFLMRYE